MGGLFSSIPLLVYMTAEPFEYPRSDLPENVRLVGPCDWDPPAEPPAWLEEVAEPIVLVTTSSEFQDDERLVRCALDALADEEVHVVATLPSGDPASFDARANSRVLPFVPHASILDRAACAVTHGGMGATQKALARGVPVCVVPFGRNQLEVARSAEVAGAGTRLPAKRLTPSGCVPRSGRRCAAARGRGGWPRAIAQQRGRSGGQCTRGADRLTPDGGHAPLSSASCSRRELFVAPAASALAKQVRLGRMEASRRRSRVNRNRTEAF